MAKDDDPSEAQADANADASGDVKSIEPKPVEPNAAGGGTAFPPRDVGTGDGPAEGKPNGDDGNISERTLVDRIKTSDRWMISLTAALVGASLLQWCELHSSGSDTHDLASDTQSLAHAAADQALAASDQATSLSSAASTAHDELEQIKKSVSAARDAADAAKIAANAAKGQLDAMKSEQRPWVSMVLSRHGGITWNAKGMVLEFDFTLTDTGKLPATATWLYGDKITFHSGEDIPSSVVKFAREIGNRRAGKHLSGDTFFPNQPYPQGVIMAVSYDDARQAVPIPGLNEFSPAFGACIDYREGFGVETMQTCIEYIVVIDDGTHPVGISRGIEIGRDYPANEVIVQPMYSYTR